MMKKAIAWTIPVINQTFTTPITIKKKKYSEKYKRDVVRMLEEKRISASSLAVDMGIGVGLLHKWKSKYGKNKGGGEIETSEAELKRLRKRLFEVEDERDILKKVVVIFTQVPKTDTRS